MNNRINKIIISLILAVTPFVGAMAQTTVKGTVKDDSSSGIPGVAVIISGTSTGVVTDNDGTYSITIPSNYQKPKLEFSCLGYESVTLEVGNRAVLDVVLMEDSQMLEETIVVGYGAMRKSDLTGSVSSVRIDEGKASRSTSIDQLIQGNAAGVQVLSNSASPDAGVSIRVRGLNSFNGSTEPLYVIDGVILNSATQNMTVLSQGADNSGSNEAVNGLMGLNPQDIESLEILKDASATAIYGALGANGVVLITTKMASRERPTVTFSAGVDVGVRSRKYNVLNFEEFVEMMEARGVDPSRYYEDPVNRTGLKVYPMDWQDYATRTAVSQRYFASVRGRNKTTSYSFSFGLSDKQGVVKNSDVDQYTLRLNVDKKIGKIVSIGTKTNLSYVKSSLTQGANSGRLTSATSMMLSMITYVPYAPLETFDKEQYDPDYDDGEYKASPDKWLTDVTNRRIDFRITPSLYADVQILPWLNFRLMAGGDYRNSERIMFKSIRMTSTDEGSSAGSATGVDLSYNIDGMFNFDKEFSGHRISGTTGVTYHNYTSRTYSLQGWHIAQYKDKENALNSAPDTMTSYSESESGTFSYLIRGIYNYRDRYVLTATYRLDGSSKFQGSNKWAHFPSAAFAWRMNQEPWFKAEKISMMKFRLGWGQVGNQALTSYRTITTYSSGLLPSHDPDNAAGTIVSIYPSNLANRDLKWETTEQVNFGIDYGMWQGRLSFSVDLYDKYTRDLLQTKTIPGSSGFTSVWVNEGNIDNRGIEFSFDATPVKTKSFEWGLSGNISFNKNTIVSIGADGQTDKIFLNPDEPAVECTYFSGSTVGSGGTATYNANIFIEGKPMGLFYGLKTDGLVQEDEVGLYPSPNQSLPYAPAGAIKYLDLDGNGIIDTEDRTIIGDPNPDFTYGFSTYFTYKKFNLRMNFNGSYGNDIVNVNNVPLTNAFSSDKNNLGHNLLRAAYYDSWTPQNTSAKYPALSSCNAYDTKFISDRWIEDGSYLRMSSASLSYDFSFGPKCALKGLTAGVTVENAFVLTKFTGWDPDVNSYGTDIKRMGCDVGSYPAARTFSLDVKLTF